MAQQFYTFSFRKDSVIIIIYLIVVEVWFNWKMIENFMISYFFNDNFKRFYDSTIV